MKTWLAARANGVIDQAIGALVALLMATIIGAFVVSTVVVPAVIERTKETVREETTKITETFRTEIKTVMVDNGWDPDLARRIHEYLTQQGVPE